MEKPNLTYIKGLSGGDISFEKEIISILKKEFPKEILLFIKSYKNKSYKEAAENIHKLKHKISILSLEKDYKLATEIEEDIKNGETKLYTPFMGILETITAFLNKQ